MAPLEAGEAQAGGIAPGNVARRELDGCPFDVLILRMHGEEADVLYLDDMNIEREVPLEEVDEVSADVRNCWSRENLISMLEEGLACLAADTVEEEAKARQASTADTNMRWEQGRFVADDGSVFLSSSASVPVTEAPKEQACTANVVKPAACGTGLRGIRCLRKNRPHHPHAVA